MKPLSAGDIKRLGAEIADLYESGDKTLTESAIEVLGKGDYTVEQIKRACEEANVTQYLKEFDKADPPRKNINFKHGPVEPNVVIKKLLGTQETLPLAERKMLKEAEVKAVETHSEGCQYHSLEKQASVLSNMLMEARGLYENLADDVAARIKTASATADPGLVRTAIEKVAGESWVANLAIYEAEKRGVKLGMSKVASVGRINKSHPLVKSLAKFAAAARECAIREVAYNNAKHEFSGYIARLAV
jgi:hypothetical protein